ncbi:unnamed protein product, partial [Medioppia subpectinata]
LRNRSFPVPIANRFLCLHALPLECATARSTATLYIPIATDYYRNQFCGNKALGRNYLVYSCNSCRAFFRRYAFRNKELYCLSNGKCIIDSKTKHLCKECRLEKCLAVGMKKELIRSDDENQLKRLLLLERKKSDKSMFQKTYSSGCDSTENFVVSAEDTNELDVMFDLIQNTHEINAEELNKQIQEIENVLTIGNNTHIDEFCHKYGALTVVPIFKSLTDYNGLNQLETSRVSELLMACKVLDYPTAKNVVKITDKSEMMRLSSIRSEYQIQDLIAFSKGLTGFSDLCSTDRLTLFKYGSVELMQIVNSKEYDIQTNSLTVYLDSNSSIFTAIILFNPNRPNLTHKHNIALEQQLYIYLLQRYLLLKYRSEWESQTRLQTLMNLVKEIIFMRELNITYGLDEYKGYTNTMGPLVKEIY